MCEIDNIDVFKTKVNSSETHDQSTASPGHPNPWQTGWICTSFFWI